MLLDYIGGGAGGDAAVLLLVGKATLILVGAVATALVMKRASAGARHLVWVGTLAALLMVPVISAVWPLQVAILPPVATLLEEGVPTWIPNDASAAGARDAATRDAAPRPEAVVPATTVNDVAVQSRGMLSGLTRLETLAVVWALVALAILAVLAHAAHTVRGIVRRGSPVQRQDWLDTLYGIADRLDLADAPRLVTSEEVRMPFACGFRTPTIVLPADCERWTVERRHAVLLHELAHVQRRDLLWHTISRITCAVYWFHPLVWTAARRLRDESERACDDVALALGARAADYAEHLLDIVSSVKGERTPVTALAMARRKEFEGRMLAILDPDVRRARPGRLQSLALMSTIAMVVVLVGAAAPVPRAAATTVRVASAAEMGDSDAVQGMTDLDRPAVDFDADADLDLDVDVDDEQSAVPAGEPAGREPRPGTPASASAAARATIADKESGAATSWLGSRQLPAADDERAALLARVLATDTSASLRRIAAWGLAEHGNDAVATNALVNALRRDADASVREMAAWALAESRGGDAVESALAQALRSDRDARIRAIAAWTLGSIEARGAIPALVAALRDADADVRQRALWAIGSSDTDRAPAELVEQLKSPDRNTRMLTAWALYEIEDPSAVPALSAALKSERDAELQLAYIRALAALGEESVDAIRGLLESPDPRVKRVAVQALAGGDAAGPWPWPWPEPRPYP